jgi:predicted MPP superfamily phosphohydrolase
VSFRPRQLLGALLALSLVLLLWWGLHFYLVSRLSSATGMASPLLLWPALALSVAYLLGRGVARFFRPAAHLLVWIGAVWMGVFCVLLSVVAVHDLFLLLPFERFASGRAPDWLLWSLRVAFGAGLLASAWGMRRALSGPRLRRLRVELAGLPQQGLRVAHLSDVHIGETIGKRYLAKVERVVREADADLVVLTGDLSDEHNGGDGSGFRMLASLPSRTGLVLACTGNHELYAGGERSIDAMGAAGIRVLRQEHVLLDLGDGIPSLTVDGARLATQGRRLVIAGIDDPQFPGGRPEQRLEAALEGVDPAVPVLLLAHQPVGLEAIDALQRQRRGESLSRHPSLLMLSGHTHGGQLPPIIWLSRLFYRYVRGLHRIGSVVLSVSNGTGYWGPPLRLGAPAEVVLYELRAA